MARFDHGESVVPAIKELCRREKVAAGWFFLIGAVTKGAMVTGPEEETLPPVPVWNRFDLPREIVGMGSVATVDGEPSIHLHAALGRGTETMTGCLRGEGEAYIVVEAMLLEMTGVDMTRAFDEKTGMGLLAFE